jgi:hypothetical protein
MVYYSVVAHCGSPIVPQIPSDQIRSGLLMAGCSVDDRGWFICGSTADQTAIRVDQDVLIIERRSNGVSVGKWLFSPSVVDGDVQFVPSAPGVGARVASVTAAVHYTDGLNEDEMNLVDIVNDVMRRWPVAA